MRISSKCSLALHILLLLAVYKHDKLTSEIMDAYPQHSYTIISTTRHDTRYDEKAARSRANRDDTRDGRLKAHQRSKRHNNLDGILRRRSRFFSKLHSSAQKSI